MPSKPTAVELDFLGHDRQNTTTISSSSNSKSQLRRLFDRQRSFRGVQNAITKIDPELLKASMAGFSPQDSNSTAGTAAVFASRKSMSVPSSPKDLTAHPAALPVYNNPGLRAATEVNNSPVAAPLTIFYNGTVSVFELPQDKVETILKFVEQGWLKNPANEEPKSSTSSDWIAQTERRMLQRNVSLQRFLEKRKERLTASPIQTGDGNEKKDIMH